MFSPPSGYVRMRSQSQGGCSRGHSVADRAASAGGAVSEELPLPCALGRKPQAMKPARTSQAPRLECPLRRGSTRTTHDGRSCAPSQRNLMPKTGAPGSEGRAVRRPSMSHAPGPRPWRTRARSASMWASRDGAPGHPLFCPRTWDVGWCWAVISSPRAQCHCVCEADMTPVSALLPEQGTLRPRPRRCPAVQSG